MKHGITTVISYRLGRSLKGDVFAYTQQWSKKLGTYIKSKWPEVDLVIMGNMTDSGAEQWVSTHESVDRFWEWWGKLFSDDEVKRLEQEFHEKEKELDTFLFDGLTFGFWGTISTE
jgi:hypothetical protein